MILQPQSSVPEPWLACRFANLAPVPRMVCCSLELSLSDLGKWIAPLSDEQIWSKPAGITSVGFHLRHLAGSTERLLTYARGESITPEQIAFMKAEAEPGASVAELMQNVRAAYEAVAAFASTAEDFDAPRFIGRARLETALGVLLAHIAEHAQRHTGQAITTAKFVTAHPAPPQA